MNSTTACYICFLWECIVEWVGDVSSTTWSKQSSVLLAARVIGAEIIMFAHPLTIRFNSAPPLLLMLTTVLGIL